MEIDQFAEFSAAVVRQLPRNLSKVAAQKWISDQAALAETLRKAFEVGYELYLSPPQKSGRSIKGFDLEEHLKSENLLDRTMSLDDSLVVGWLAEPSTYPEEFKGKAVFLWKSQHDSVSRRGVAYLDWDDDRVVVYWYWLGHRWDGDDPVLLTSS